MLHGIGPLNFAKGFFHARCEERPASVPREDLWQRTARSEILKRAIAFDGDTRNVEAVQVSAGPKMATVITEGPIESVAA